MSVLTLTDNRQQQRPGFNPGAVPLAPSRSMLLGPPGPPAGHSDEGPRPRVDAAAATFPRAVRRHRDRPENGRPPRLASERVADCGQQKVVVRCPDCGQFYTLLVRCRSRFCPHCARSRSMAWFHRLAAVSWHFPMMLTLSMLPGPDVAASVSLALDAFRKLRRCYGFTRWVYAIEVNPNPAGWYVHVHALVDCGRWLDMPRLLAVWHGLTGASIGKVNRVDRHRVGGLRGALAEVVKYITKGVSDGKLSPAEVDSLDAATRGRRLVAASRSLALSLLDTQETSLQPDRVGLLCPACGSGLQFACLLPVQAFSDLPVYVYPVEGARAGPPDAALTGQQVPTAGLDRP